MLPLVPRGGYDRACGAPVANKGSRAIRNVFSIENIIDVQAKPPPPPVVMHGRIDERAAGHLKRVVARALGAAHVAHARSETEITQGAAMKRIIGSEEHTSELQSLMRISYAVFCLTKKKTT